MNANPILGVQAQLVLQGCVLLVYGAQQGGMLEELAADLQVLCTKYVEQRKRELEVGER